MIIGFDAKRAFHNSTGLGNYGRSIIQLLAKYYPENDYQLYTPLFNEGLNFLPASNINISVHTPQGLINRAFPSIWRSGSGLVKDLERDEVQIYHGLSNELPFGIEKTTIKTVVTIHDVIFKRFPQLYPAFDRKMYERKWTHAISIADKIIAVSEQTKSDVLEFFKVDEQKIEVIYPAFDKRILAKSTEAKQKECLAKYGIEAQYILSVGRIEERKNLKIVIEALALMNENERPLFVVAGKKTDYFPKLQSLVEKNGLQKSVLFLHTVSDDELNCLYHSAMTAVYPSVFEGFGLPVIEAQGAGIPVICSDNTLMHETSGEAALFADAHNPQVWKEKIIGLKKDRDVSGRMKQAGLENIKRFEGEKVTGQLVNLYEKLLS